MTAPLTDAELDALERWAVTMQQRPDGVRRANCRKVARLISDVRRLRGAAREADALLDQFPSGLEVDPDPDNPAPDDAFAFLGGLMRRTLRRALTGEDQ